MNIKPYIDEIEKRKLHVEGITVIQGGKERARHRWIPEHPRTMYSVSKGFASIAAGMAIDEGRLRLCDKVTGILKRQEPDPRWDSLTLEHLLTMTMGHPQFTRPGSLKEALSYKLTSDPGSCFIYDNTCTFLISAMLTEVTGLTLRDYLLDRLFRPLNIPDPEWTRSADGYTTGAAGLTLTTSQMALFGRFLLQGGNWEGRQLVSRAWIEAATRTQVPTRQTQDDADCDLGYGYQFWTCRHGAYRLDGREGQFLVIFPALDAVAAINSTEKNIMPILWAVWDHILPELKAACH
ncbi:MAG: beta-lactamase family protein [Treponema sp.]|nr:beta-lactamase family protein [Treponema sp.]